MDSRTVRAAKDMNKTPHSRLPLVEEPHAQKLKAKPDVGPLSQDKHCVGGLRSILGCMGRLPVLKETFETEQRYFKFWALGLAPLGLEQNSLQFATISASIVLTW